MHVPDGFLDAPVSLGTGVVAAGAVALSLRGARREFGGGRSAAGVERTAPLAGLVAAFVFAVQMLNFPVAAGTSGHLLGGALAAVLVGPYTAVLCLSVVLLMQAVLFADGGLTALGTNITLMGVITAVVAYATFRGLLLVLPRGRSAVTVATFVGALVSVPVSALAFSGLYALGGTAEVSLGRVVAAMVGVHVLIGLGEAVITTLVVGAVLSVRPDLVYGARDLMPTLAVRVVRPTAPTDLSGRAASSPEPPATPEPAGGRGGEPDRAAPGAAAPELAGAGAAAGAGTAAGAGAGPPVSAAGGAGPRRSRSTRALWAWGVAAALVCAGGVSFYASASPDGLEKVADEHGFDEEAREHDLADSPLADYGVRDVSDERLSVGLAGAAGVAVTLGVGTGVFFLVRRWNHGGDAGTSAPAGAAATGTAGTVGSADGGHGRPEGR